MAENEQKRKRGRPRKIKEKSTKWELPEGIHFVARASSHPQSRSHRWMAFIDNRVLGYYRSQNEAIEAREKKLKEVKDEVIKQD
jgi:hypothetical protein